MECYHCGVFINLKLVSTSTYSDSLDSDVEELDEGWRIGHGFCPNCNGLIIIKDIGFVAYDEFNGDLYLASADSRVVLYPSKNKFSDIPIEVPTQYVKELKEARDTFKVSQKASASLSRRILQRLLEDELGLKRPTLSEEIEDFIKQNGIPSYLSGAVDAVRNVGNFAAHPIKDKNTGEIVEVEEGEAEWLLEVLDSFFDFVFVQPIRLQKRVAQLNEKLEKLGKPPMKGT